MSTLWYTLRKPSGPHSFAYSQEHVDKLCLCFPPPCGLAKYHSLKILYGFVDHTFEFIMRTPDLFVVALSKLERFQLVLALVIYEYLMCCNHWLKFILRGPCEQQTISRQSRGLRCFSCISCKSQLSHVPFADVVGLNFSRTID